jgi:DNA relaxase NicK
MSGERSDAWAEYFRNAEWTYKIYCTRLDLQVTIKEPGEHHGVALYNSVHRKVKSLVKSPGVTTVYVGARSSQLFIRVYEKVLDERFLRCEFELKQDYARNAWESLVMEKATREDLFNSCLKKSSLPTVYREWFKTNSDRTDALSSQQLEKDLQAQLMYLKNTEIALTKLLHQHSTQQAVYGLIGRLERLRTKLT